MDVFVAAIMHTAPYGVWWFACVALLIAEGILPGRFLVWVGMAAGVTGGWVLFFPGMYPAGQTLMFILAALAGCVLDDRILRPRARRCSPPDPY